MKGRYKLWSGKGDGVCSGSYGERGVRDKVVEVRRVNDSVTTVVFEGGVLWLICILMVS